MMDDELKQQLDCMNTNLTAIVENQAMLYCELKAIETLLSKTEEKGC